MSIKDNISMVKEELNSEEKFFEKAVISERFVKKYKNVMIGSVALVVILVAANIVYDANKQSKINSANSALLTLQKDKKDSFARSELQALSPVLYDVWVYSQAIVDKDFTTLKELKNSKAFIISDLVSYELAQNTKDIASLVNYSSSQGAIYKDLALVQSAVFLMNESKIDEAHQKLVQIGERSSLARVAKALLHYGVK